MNTASNTVDGGLCSGCGTCAGVCPAGCLKIAENSFGEYRPVLENGGCTNCGICTKICPFTDEIGTGVLASMFYKDIPDIKYNYECGYFKGCYLGFSSRHRERASSGGMATWFLETLLKNNVVDAVVCVGSGSSHKKLFEYRIVENPIELKECSKSAYYPVELSEVIKEIKKNNKKYALIGLPCFIKAIKKAAMIDKRLSERIVITAGLVCGHLPSKAMVEYVANCMGRKLNEIKNVAFRVKEKDVPVSNYAVRYQWSDGTSSITRGSDYFGLAFYNRLFSQDACEACDDIFAECADIVFMDAWLEEYAGDTCGTSIVVTRSELADEIVGKYAGENVSEASIEKALKAQRNVSLVEYKRNSLYSRVKGAKNPKIKKVRLRYNKPGLKKRMYYYVKTACWQRARSAIRKRWSMAVHEESCFSNMQKQVIAWIKIMNMAGTFMQQAGKLTKTISGGK